MGAYFQSASSGGKLPEPEATKHLWSDQSLGMGKSVSWRARAIGAAQLSTLRFEPWTSRNLAKAPSVTSPPGSAMASHRRLASLVVNMLLTANSVFCA